jgi:hypothetical protein
MIRIENRTPLAAPANIFTQADETLTCLEAARLKAMILTEGVKLTQSALKILESWQWKTPRMVRSGMSGGLEFYLKYGKERIAVSCSIANFSTDRFPLTLTTSGGRMVLVQSAPQREWEVELLREPSFYAKLTSSGKEMASVAQQCFSKLAVGVFGTCSFSLQPETACAFCAIRSIVDTDAPVKTDEDILETLEVAYVSEIGEEIETVMLGGGTPALPDHGAQRFAVLATEIRRRFPKWQVTVMMAPPAEDSSLLQMKDAGVKEISINLEFESEEAFEQYTPGKSRTIGRKRYLESLVTAVRIFGTGNVQSLLVAGLESYENTLRGVDWLASHGIIPVLSPFRPLSSTVLATHPAPDPDDLCKLYFEARRIASDHGMFIGPKCIPCQCNTMALPWDSSLYPK